MNSRLFPQKLKCISYFVKPPIQNATDFHTSGLLCNLKTRKGLCTSMQAMTRYTKENLALRASLFQPAFSDIELKRVTFLKREESARDFFSYNCCISKRQSSNFFEEKFQGYDERIKNTSTAKDWRDNGFKTNYHSWKSNRNSRQAKENGKGRAFGGGGLFVTAFSFNFFGSKDDKESEDPQEKLIMQIKRSMLCIHRGQFDKAEQMLHLALRMAQDLQSKDGITYVYDVMANLAMEREQYKKAEKLFADVLKRLFTEGHGEDSAKVLHISAKLAHIAQLQGDFEKANQGFVWTLERIVSALKKLPDDKDMQEMYGLTRNWYGQLLMILGKFSEAKNHFEAAHSTLTNIYGENTEAAITILNNLSVASVNLDDYTGAKEYLMKALGIAQEMKNTKEEGILYANLGLVYLRQGLRDQAKEACALAYRIGKKENSNDAVEQAEYCLKEIKASL